MLDLGPTIPFLRELISIHDTLYKNNCMKLLWWHLCHQRNVSHNNTIWYNIWNDYITNYLVNNYYINVSVENVCLFLYFTWYVYEMEDW